MLRTAQQLRASGNRRAYTRVGRAFMNTLDRNGWDAVYAGNNGEVAVLTDRQMERLRGISNIDARDRFISRASNGGSVG